MCWAFTVFQKDYQLAKNKLKNTAFVSKSLLVYNQKFEIINE